jgi:hypothetical protein
MRKGMIRRTPPYQLNQCLFNFLFGVPCAHTEMGCVDPEALI